MSASVRPAVFFDTNVLVYGYDKRDAGKQKVARKLLDEVVANKQAVISSQVIQEFCNVVIYKIGGVSVEDLNYTVETVLAPMLGHLPSPQFYCRATLLRERYGLRFYDALIVQAALDLGCTTLYSEDMQDGQKIGVLTIVNPFA